MSFMESVITQTRTMEGLLEKNFGATGRGLHEKASSVERALGADLVKKIRYVATIRNKLMHEADYDFDGDEGAFLAQCDQIVTSLEHPSAIERRAVSRPVWLPLQPTRPSYSRLSAPDEVLPPAEPSTTRPARWIKWTGCLGLLLVLASLVYFARKVDLRPLATAVATRLPAAAMPQSTTPATATYQPKALVTQVISATATSPGKCPIAANPGLTVTLRAYVSDKLTSTLRVRASPALNANTAGTLASGENIRIMDGPVCADGYWWWNVASETQTNLRGWAAGGQGATYWLLPVK